jgi:predicted porin
MKKTLVAVAALAIAGGAFAQSSVTVSGKFAAAYQAKKDGAGLKANGFLVTDGNVTFAASEDLGGGMKAGASMDVRVRGRGPAGVVDGRDAYVYVSGGFGEVKVGSVDGQYQTLLDLANPLYGIGLDSCNTKFNCGDAYVDMLQYTTPSMSGFTASVMLADGNAAGTGPGAGGMQSTALSRDSVQLGLAYSNGPLNAGFEYTSFGANASVGLSKSRYRLSGNYSLGAVTIGAGFGSEKYAAFTQKETALGISAPLGAVTVGLNYVNAKSNGTTESGWEAVANYDLSKRTAIQVAYMSEDANLANRITTFRTRLMHKF